MKKTRKLFATLLSLVMILTALPLTAVTSFAETSGDFEYIILDNGTAEITGYIGSATEWEIPSLIEGYTVTSIGTCAFLYYESLKSVTIPDSVTSIGDSAFEGCISLESITIPDSVTSIGDWVFYDCTSLETVTIPDSVTSIGDSVVHDTAYYNNDSNWENDVLYIGNHLIDAKYTVSVDYTIKDGTKTIAAGAFEECTSLEKITIPDSVISIGDGAFACTSLESITIPDSVTSIGYRAFLVCTSLTSINVSADNANYTSVDGVLFNKDETELICYPVGNKATAYVIPDGVTSIGDDAFYGCTSLESITIPDSVTSISFGAFYDCTSLKSLTIPDGVTSIADCAFLGCESLESITIPDGVTSIGVSVFEACTSLESITIPDGVTSIADCAFIGCTSLDSITIPDSVTSIGNDAFYNTAYYNNASNWENDVLYIGNHLIEAKDTVSGDYTIKDGTKIIADGAFMDCTSLDSITIPDSVTSISDGAFVGCTSLESITIPDSVTSIGYSAFYDTAYYNNDSNWENDVLYIGNRLIQAKDTISGDYTVKDGTKTIADGAFMGCASLENIAIPDSVTSIGDSAFQYCASLENITIPNGVTSIGEAAFLYCASLKSVTIGDSVTSIGEAAFFDCSSLESITIPDSVTNIGDDAFGYYYSGYIKAKIEGFTIYGYAGSEAERYANENEFEFVALDKPEPAPSEASGDVNGDGKLSTVDAKWILQNLASTRELTDEQKAFADVNGDGKLSVVDAKWILQALAGLRELS